MWVKFDLHTAMTALQVFSIWLLTYYACGFYGFLCFHSFRRDNFSSLFLLLLLILVPSLSLRQAWFPRASPVFSEGSTSACSVSYLICSQHRLIAEMCTCCWGLHVFCRSWYRPCSRRYKELNHERESRQPGGGISWSWPHSGVSHCRVHKRVS